MLKIFVQEKENHWLYILYRLRLLCKQPIQTWELLEGSKNSIDSNWNYIFWKLKLLSDKNSTSELDPLRRYLFCEVPNSSSSANIFIFFSSRQIIFVIPATLTEGSDMGCERGYLQNKSYRSFSKIKAAFTILKRADQGYPNGRKCQAFNFHLDLQAIVRYGGEKPHRTKAL